jgi:2-methylcitrate dehydratase PrpD
LISKVFSDFIVRFDLEKAGPHLNRNHLRSLLIDAIACGVAGTRGPYADEILRTYQNLSTLQQSSLLCSDRKTAAPHAAFVNSYFARNYTFDDVYEPGVIHSGAAMIMSSLAVGEWLKATLDEALAAIICGYEVAARISEAINPAHYDRGFHPTGTCNTVGVAASAARLLGLDAQKTCTALRLAADQACGFRQYQLDGNIANSAFHASKSAENGILAALLAKEGFSDPGETISGKFGLMNSMAGPWDEAKLISGLGIDFSFLKTSLKPYPSCRYMHGAVDAVAKCRSLNKLSLQDVKKINVHTFKMAFEEGNRPKPETVLDAQFSIHYNVATYLLKDAIGVEDFSPEAIRGKEALQWCGKISVYEDEALTRRYPEEWPFRAEIIDQNGRVLTFQVDHPPGSSANPLEPGELEKKCFLLLRPVLGKERTESLMRGLSDLENFSTVNHLFAFLKETT